MKFRRPSKKNLLIGGLALVVIASAAVIFFVKHRTTKPAVSTERSPTINYGPATETEKKEVDANKDRIVKENQTTNTTPTAGSGNKSVTPIITNTSRSINAYVTGIFEDGGTCTATFTKDGTSLSKSSVGFQNVSYTQCAPIDETPGFLSSGKWSVTVTYTSPTAEGTSAAQTFEVN